MGKLKSRLSRLEKKFALRSGPHKRAVPEWLQETYEQQGLRFDAAGQVLGMCVPNEMQTRLGCTGHWHGNAMTES